MEIVYYDLETTGLNPSNKQKGIELLEIGAISCSLGLTFQQYILPTTPIPSDATQVHGLFLKKKEDSSGELDFDRLYIKDKGGCREVEAVDKLTGINRFLAWLATFQKRVTLAGYNSHNYDDWVLCHEMQGLVDKGHIGIHKLADVAKIVRPVLKEKFQTRKWKLGFAVDHLLERKQEMAHGALSDAVDARDLLKEVARIKNVTTKGVLVDNEKAWIDFDEVWVVCFNMVSSNEKKILKVIKENPISALFQKKSKCSFTTLLTPERISLDGSQTKNPEEQKSMLADFNKPNNLDEENEKIKLPCELRLPEILPLQEIAVLGTRKRKKSLNDIKQDKKLKQDFPEILPLQENLLRKIGKPTRKKKAASVKSDATASEMIPFKENVARRITRSQSIPF